MTTDTPCRCGVSDNIAFAINALPNRWKLRELNWFIESYPAGLDPAAVDAVFTEACRQWSLVTNMAFKRTHAQGLAHILVRVRSGPAFGLDGKGNIVALGQLPPWDDYVNQLLITLDAEERWATGIGVNSVQLAPVLRHELGHVLGLTHSTLSGQLMSQGALTVATPQADDRRRMQELYGPPVGAPPPPPPPPPAADVVTAAFVTSDGKHYSGTVPRVA